MRPSPPALAPYLRSVTQAELLAALLLHPDRQESVADLARRLGTPPSVALAEVNRLVEAGVLRETRVGRARLIQANPEYRLIAPLTEIISSTHGPLTILAGELVGIPGIAAAYLYGSWAARYRNQPGPEPRDVDVLVVGSPTRAALNEAAERAEVRLGYPVNIAKASTDAWDEDAEPFLRTVRQRPLVELEVATGV